MAVPNLWRTKEQRYRLQGNVCPACSNTIFPPKRVCPHCQHGSASLTTNGSESDKHEHSYSILFEMPKMVELSAVGDD